MMRLHEIHGYPKHLCQAHGQSWMLSLWIFGSYGTKQGNLHGRSLGRLGWWIWL